MLLRALHTPGHAAGHLAFHIEDRGLLIAGDLISGLSTILIDPEHGDMDAYLESLARVHACRCKMLLPGHGPPLLGGRLGALIDHRRERERRILAALESGSTALGEIALAAYADTPGLPAALTEGQSLAHLRGLERRGRAARVGADWRPADAS
jgi:glyoxylase-like metal-dependent hydrolase (beta-lactamase superfamily II)